MEVNKDELEARYASLSDDELASIHTTSDLTPLARGIMDAEIQRRNLVEDDFIRARDSDRIVVEDRVQLQEIANDIRWFQRATAKGSLIGLVLGLLIYGGFQIAIFLSN